MVKKIAIYMFNIFLFLILINSISSATLVKAAGNINFSCEQNVFYITMDVIFTKKPKPKRDFYPFILTLSSPEDLQFKCILHYKESKIKCLHSFSNENDFIEEGDLFKFPLNFPAIEGIIWDFNTFLNEVFKRVYKSQFSCGAGSNNKIFTENVNKYDLEGSIIDIKKGSCEPASISKLDHHRYYFDLVASFNGGEILEDLDSNIFLIHDIWVPLITEELYGEDLPFAFAFCSSNEAINKTSISSYKLNCYIPIELDSIFKDTITINSFFDKVYIRKGNEIDLIGINFNIKQIENPLFEQENEIVCPNLPVFRVEDKDSIMMGEFNLSKVFTFFIVGTITNGYYTFKNGTMVELAQTYKEIKFNLIIQDNFIDSEENDVEVQCSLPEGTPYDEDDEAIIKCTGKKFDATNVDVMLNWNVKENNNFENIIIKWPKAYDGKRKNLYGYELKGISIRQSDYGCRDNSFDFYVYIYDLGKEPKISFELPLASPKDTMAECKLFDKTTLKCSVNLRHKKLSRGTKIELPEKGIINVIENYDGNRIEFLTHNFTEIGNENDLFVKTRESCGNYLLVGTLKDMGMSHKTSNITYVIIMVFVFFFVICSAIYIAYKCKLNYDRGTRLTEQEESKNNANITGASAKK